ncbi:putative malate dehydrogenase 1B [Polyrhizophydium stewartii]|uniref:Malate dehydrogenase 1B n=1 Tax=Polyrhizophydium stewartii TaxID=2732419 RepID=A0ABR4NF26_9FUNG
MLGYFLERNLPDFHVAVEPRPDADWRSFVEHKFRENGWDMRSARDRNLKKPDAMEQLIWIETGELVGDACDFLKLIKHSYNHETNLDDALLGRIAVENVANLKAGIKSK